MFSLRRLGPHFGAEISGIDLSSDIDAETFRAIERAYVEHSVVLIRGQRLSDQRHVDFSRRFGELEIHVLHEYVHPDHPELFRISNIIENRLMVFDSSNAFCAACLNSVGREARPSDYEPHTATVVFPDGAPRTLTYYSPKPTVSSRAGVARNALIWSGILAARGCCGVPTSSRARTAISR